MVGMKNITVTKRDLTMPIKQLIQGDSCTSGVTININRYEGGVDLASLGWCINVMNSEEESDIIPFTPTVGDMWLTYDWIFPEIVGSEIGNTVFELEAVNADEKMVWKSGKRYIQVIEGLEASSDYMPRDISIFQKTVTEVGVKVRDMETTVTECEERIAAAVSNAETAAIQASEAIQSVEDVVNIANTAADSASQAVLNANSAITSATTAIDRANIVADKADIAANRATEVADDLALKAATGFFNGRDGNDGINGVNGKDGKDGIDGINGVNGVDGLDGISVTHSWNGTRLTVTSASGTSTADLKGEKGDIGPQGPAGKDGIGIKGDKGDKGDDGYTPIKGVDYRDGVDGRDGIDGKDWIPTETEIDNIAASAANKVQPSVTTLKEDIKNDRGTDEQWSESKSYAVGAYVISDNALWRCILAHSGQRPSEGTYWTKVSLASLKNELTIARAPVSKTSVPTEFAGSVTRYGLVVNCSFYMSIPAVSGGTALANIPTGYRPASETYVTGGSGNTSYTLVIRSDGEIRAGGAFSSAKYINFNAVYICKMD